MGKADFGSIGITKKIIIEDKSKQQGFGKRGGRPKINEISKRNVAVGFLLTKEESDKLTEKAGLTPKGAFIRACLQEAGIF